MATPTIAVPERSEVPLRKSPQSLLIYGNFKVGKTTAVAVLPDTLLLEIQPGGADFVPSVWAMRAEKELPGPHELVAVLEFLKARRNEGKPVAKRIVIDHIGILDDWLFDLALESFFTTPIGQGFKKREGGLNRITDLPGVGGSGGSPGWGWYWQELHKMHFRILAAADEVIYLGHVRDRSINKEAGDVQSQDVDLSGNKARRIFCGNSSAVGFMFRRQQAGEDQLVVTFKTTESLFCGSSCPYLSGREFTIGRSKNGAPPVFDWSAIYS